MAQKVATARKMKSRQETTSLGQIATVSDKHDINTDTRHFKIQTGDMDPLPIPWQGLTISHSTSYEIKGDLEG